MEQIWRSSSSTPGMGIEMGIEMSRNVVWKLNERSGVFFQKKMDLNDYC